MTDRPHAPPRSNRSRIYALFLGLAALTLVALGLSLGLFHRLVSLHQIGVQRNAENAEEIRLFDRLENLASDMVTSTDEVFLKGETVETRSRITGAALAFREQAAILGRMLTHDLRHANVIRRLEAAVPHAAQVEQDSVRVIDKFSRGDLGGASRAMAEADREHEKVFHPLQEAEDLLHDEETVFFQAQQREFARIGQHERVIGVVLLLLTSAVVLYGRGVVREMITANEREAYIRQLKAREAELKTAVAERDQQTRSLEEAQSIANLGSFQRDLLTDRAVWSPEVHRIFGTSPETFDPSFAGYLSHVHPEDRERAQRIVRASLKSLEPFAFEHRIVRAGGEVRTLSARGDVAGDGSGRPVRMFGIVQDITDRRAAEEQLRSSEERFQLAARATNDAIWDWNVVTNDLWFNEGWTKFYGHPSGDIQIAGWSDAIHPEDRNRVMVHIHAALDGDGSAWEDEYRVRTADGDYRDVFDRGFILRDGEHKAVRMIGAMADISSRKEAEDSIADLHLTTQLILNSAADGLFGMDLQGVSTFVNPAAAHILGYEPNELAGRQVHSITHSRHEDGSDYPWEECLAAQTIADGAGRSGTGVFWRKSGKGVPVDFSCTAMADAHGVVTGAVMTFRDISQRLVVDRMKDEFVSTVSHELRTPLTSIRGALGLLGSGRLGVMPEKAARLLEIASSNTDRLVRLINDILDIERMESGKATLIKSPTNAAELIRQATDTMQQMAGEAGITIAVNAESVPLSADPDRIVQTLTNLIGNAVKFSPPQTTIRVTAKTTGGNLLFGVADHGRGIPAEKLQLVFERFKQVDASDSRDKGGSGLGLAICRSIVQQHGGEIWVQSEEGRGSEFFFTIPLSAGQKNAEVLTPETTGPDRLVYVCDDDEDARQVMSALLSAHGYRVVEFISGAAVVRASIHQRPDLVLLDIFMPDMNGWETLSRFKTDARIADIPVVIVSVLSPDECESPYAGLHGWLHKPLEEGEFFQTVTDALRSGAPSRRMLVVEDDADLARIIASSFERYGLEVIIASTGQQAIDLAATMVPDLLVLDLLLPEVDGFGVIDWIKDHNLWQNVPLIVYSALETTPSQQDRLRLGTTEFITKSTIGPEAFERRVLRLLDRITESSRPPVAPGVESVL